MNSNQGVVVAMSGGVDSSVAAHLLRKNRSDIVGVSMQVWDYRNQGGCQSRATCCAPDDFTDARKVASMIDIPYYVFDFEASFRREVIDNFVQTYMRGETPNPCIDCNSKVKFRELRDRAKALGCAQVATGHYARIRKDQSGFHLIRGNDRSKDQSYFLYGLLNEELPLTLFPVGEMTKSEVREIAELAGLPTADKPESQDICFVSGMASDFVAKISGGKKRGRIVNKNRVQVGQHEGVHQFTVGQRRGLGVGGMSSPSYVIEIDPVENEVIIGERSDLERRDFFVGELNWIQIPQTELFDCFVQVRSRHQGVPARVKIIDKRCKVTFIDQAATVSPGQAAVFYDQQNAEVLGGGRILSKH